MAKRIENVVDDTKENRYKRHQERHMILHSTLDELVDNFTIATGLLPSETTILTLMEWSNRQASNPT